MSRISHLQGREIIDSRGCPTVEVEVFLTNGVKALASVPSGASTGQYEALELRDGEKGRFFGKGVKKAVQNISLISSALKGMDITRQGQIDDKLLEMDGTPFKSRLGANTLLGVSLACLRVAARARDIPLYQHLRDLSEGFLYENEKEGLSRPEPFFSPSEKTGRAGSELEEVKKDDVSSQEGGALTPVELKTAAGLSKPFSLLKGLLKIKNLQKKNLQTKNLQAESLQKGIPPSQSRHRFTLPVPLINIINGGVHAENNLQIQEFMIVPWKFESFRSALQSACEVFYQLKKDLLSGGFSTNVGDEGGFAPQLSCHREALDLILSSINKCGYSGRMGLALDCASSEFYEEGFYHFEGKKQKAKDMVDFYENWIQNYPIFSIEDGLAEEDWEGWKLFTERLGDRIQIVGDDLFVTQTQRLRRGVKEGTANSLLVKCNQAGTVSETLSAVSAARRAGYTCVMSHRSGETEDTMISDLSVGWGCEQIKTGSVCRGERTAKYNRLLRIEEELKGDALFFGKRAFSADIESSTARRGQGIEK